MASARTRTRTRPRKPARHVAKPARSAKAAKPAAKSTARPAVRPAVKAIPKPAAPVAPRTAAKVAERHPEPAPAFQPQPFRLVAIERAEPPVGAGGKSWYRYTITQGANAINGYLQGTATGVRHAAEQIVGQLNERRAGRWGYRTTRATTPAQAS